MPNFNFVNLSSSLPFDERVKNKFYKVFDESKMKYFFRNSYLNTINIFFINQIPKKPNDNDIEIEPLGYYTSFDSPSRNEAIFVCPEDIYSTVIQNISDYHLEPTIDSLQHIYQTVLLKVIIHEIAHALMSSVLPEFERMIKRDWSELCAASLNAPIAISINDFDELVIEKSKYSHKTIEESLANAFCLLHNWDEYELYIVKTFIKNQPPCYREACFWYEDGRLLNIMKDWKDLKFLINQNLKTVDKKIFDDVEDLANSMHQYWNHGSKTCSVNSRLLYKNQFLV